MESETNIVPIWVLLGAKHGDNQQLLSIAEALKLPFRTIPLRFNRLARQAPVLLGTSRLSWCADVPLGPPWPSAVLAAGRKSVPAARWIRRQSHGRTRLIHVNRPWAPLSWFDLIVSTPQYALPERPNVLANLLPFISPSSAEPMAAALPNHASTLPRPWTVVLVGGKSRPFVLNATAAAELAKTVNAEVRNTGGSAWLLDSPRTPAATMAIIEQSLEVPSHVIRWRDGENLYGTLLGLADRFIVTSDSASMLTEALLTGRPVARFDLPAKPDLKWRIASAWRAAAVRAPASMIARSFEVAVNLGLLSSVRDLERLHRALDHAGLFSTTGRPRELSERERQATLARIAQVIEGC
ncbi:MAG: ELM1/GtrOC1 family putative glycosyltransferase [Burkholderiaceae bacterium]|nr:ELM1/GtrOC1 family putative glycosyltransferase [Burkholderiaceae bacterium]